MLMRDVYLDSNSLRYEYTLLDHCIHHLLEEKKITLDDLMIDFEQVTYRKVDHEQCLIGIFSVL
jgi:hypothetical protein